MKLSLLMLLWTASAVGAELPQVLWREPGAPTMNAWICGPGGCDRTPAPPFQFLREDTTGTNAKISVRDARGNRWSAKFGAEVIPECFAARFAAVLGYASEANYCVAEGALENVGKLHRARRFISQNGRFRNARFELREQPELVFLQGQVWAWTDNPFRGSHELAGLKIVMMLLSNWDAKDARDGADESNNGVFRRAGSRGPELAFAVFDWGASLGTWGGVWRRDQSDCAGFAKDTAEFVKGVSHGEIEFGYRGKHAEDVRNRITVEDVQWLLPWLERIGDDQLHAGLTASGATERQARCWAGAIRNRIAQLEAVAR